MKLVVAMVTKIVKNVVKTYGSLDTCNSIHIQGYLVLLVFIHCLLLLSLCLWVCLFLVFVVMQALFKCPF